VERLIRNGPPHAEIHLLREYDPEAEGDTDVPDPYYGGPDGFDTVHDIVERSCRELLEYIRQTHEL
jgi:protein-tyrosine phosphatase